MDNGGVGVYDAVEGKYQILPSIHSHTVYTVQWASRNSSILLFTMCGNGILLEFDINNSDVEPQNVMSEILSINAIVIFIYLFTNINNY